MDGVDDTRAAPCLPINDTVFQPADWLYKAEGRANVAYSYIGSENCWRGHVLRVRKVKRGKRSYPFEAAPLRTLASDVSLPPTDPLAFARDVMTPLLGREYLIPAVQVSCPPGSALVSSLDMSLQVHPGRPAGRVGTHLDIASPGVVLMLDHSLLPGRNRTLCVEIKPKNGFPPAPCDPACRYCMHQVAKALHREGEGGEAEGTEGEEDGVAGGVGQGRAHGPMPTLPTVVSRLSHYCPLDLYSGQPHRVRKALEAILHAPQNNMRVFVEGMVVFPPPASHGHVDGRHAVSMLDAAIRDALWGPPECAAGGGGALDALLVGLSALLCTEPLLPRLAAVQGLAGPSSDSAEAGMKAYTRVARGVGLGVGVGGGTESSSSTYEGIPLAAWVDCAPAMEHSLATSGGGTTSSGNAAGTAPSASSERDEIHEMEKDVMCLRNVLLAASAKDCSLMVALHTEDEGQEDPLPTGSALAAHPSRRVRSLTLPALQGVGASARPIRCTVSLAVVDLDAKPLARIPEYWSQEKDIAAAFERHGARLFGQAGKACSHAQPSPGDIQHG